MIVLEDKMIYKPYQVIHVGETLYYKRK
jgi:hypothetical protein